MRGFHLSGRGDSGRRFRPTSRRPRIRWKRTLVHIWEFIRPYVNIESITVTDSGFMSWRLFTIMRRHRPTSNARALAHNQMCTNWHLVGSLSRRLCKVVGRPFLSLSSRISRFSPYARAGSFNPSFFRGITVAHSLTLSLNSIYLPLLCQLALQHYRVECAPMVGRRPDRPNGSDVVPPGRPAPREGQSVR